MNQTKLFPYDDLSNYFANVVDYESIAMASMLNKHSYNIFSTDLIFEYGDCMRTKAWIESPFQVACKKGYLKLAIDIFERTNDISKLNINNAFQQCCFHEQVNVIKWLYEIMISNNLLNNETINISIKYVKLKNTFEVIGCMYELKILSSIQIESELSNSDLHIWIREYPKSKYLKTILNEMTPLYLSNFYKNIRKSDKNMAVFLFNNLKHMQDKFTEINSEVNQIISIEPILSIISISKSDIHIYNMKKYR